MCGYLEFRGNLSRQRRKCHSKTIIILNTLNFHLLLSLSSQIHAIPEVSVNPYSSTTHTRVYHVTLPTSEALTLQDSPIRTLKQIIVCISVAFSKLYPVRNIAQPPHRSRASISPLLKTSRPKKPDERFTQNPLTPRETARPFYLRLLPAPATGKIRTTIPRTMHSR